MKGCGPPGCLPMQALPVNEGWQPFSTFTKKYMPSFNLDKEMSIEVKARLIAKGSDAPLTGEAYTVKLFDKDFFDDDFLGESALDNYGTAKIIFNPGRYDANDPIKEKTLDFYFAVFKNGKEIFRSKVMENVDKEAVDQFKMGEGEIIDLGTFLIEP